MKSNFNDVVLFHEKFGIMPDDVLPHFLPTDVYEFRHNFMLEELREYQLAYEASDLPKAFDALLDLVYVAMGTAVLMALPWEKGWDAVQAANMKKVRASSAAESAAGTGRGHILDVIKPTGWQPPDIAAILLAHQQLMRRIKEQMDLDMVYVPKPARTTYSDELAADPVLRAEQALMDAELCRVCGERYDQHDGNEQHRFVAR